MREEGGKGEEGIGEWKEEEGEDRGKGMEGEGRRERTEERGRREREEGERKAYAIMLVWGLFRLAQIKSPCNTDSVTPTQ